MLPRLQTAVLTSVQILAALCPLWDWKFSRPQAGKLLELHHPCPSITVCNAKGNTTLGERSVAQPESKKGWCIFHIKDQVLSGGEDISIFPAEEEVKSNSWHS